MKSRLLIGLFVFAFVAIAACNFSINLNNDRVRGSGNLVTEEREVSDFDRVELNGAGELIIEQGDSEALTVETDDNLMQYIRTEVRDGRLVLEIKPSLNIMFMEKLIYRLTVKELREVQISGSGKVTMDRLETDELKIGTSGSGKFEFGDLQANSLSARTSGSGQFIIAGKVEETNVDINGSGKFNCPDLESTNTDVSISGSGEVTTWTSGKLDVNISGSGSVRYYGNPQTNQSISGSGSVKKLGDK